MGIEDAEFCPSCHAYQYVNILERYVRYMLVECIVCHRKFKVKR